MEKAKASTAATKLLAYLTQFMFYIRGLEKTQISSEKRSFPRTRITSLQALQFLLYAPWSLKHSSGPFPFIPGMSSYRHENRVC